jgi:predicted molibdopterin-dependent oxidoreductase YjgC
VTPERVTITVDGRAIAAERGTTLAAALMNANVRAFRVSVRGEPRGALCGMGVCFECRVTVDGVPHQRACLLACEDGMTIDTGARA